MSHACSLPLTAAATIDGRTLQEFLAVTREELTARMNSDTLVAVARDSEKQFANWMATTHWPHLTDEVADHLCGFLQENVVSIFAGAWSKYAELRRCAKPTREDPRSTTDVALADHDFTWEMTPASTCSSTELKSPPSLSASISPALSPASSSPGRAASTGCAAAGAIAGRNQLLWLLRLGPLPR